MSELEQLKKEVRELRDIVEIQRVVGAVSLYSDLGDHAAGERLYTKDATLDYSSMFGPDASTTDVGEFWKQVMEFLPGFDATHHQTTNFDVKVDGDTATAVSMVRATHRIGDDTANNGGVYEHYLVRTPEGWRIKRQSYRATFFEKEQLIEKARAQATKKAQKA
jgi:ketosteroid isomerase-like protein